MKLFVTGTDTGVGKTYLTALLAREARTHGRSVAAVKPIESGSGTEERDSAILRRAAGMPGRNVLFQLDGEVAPGVAAKQAGVAVSLVELAGFAASFPEEVVLVEGAGGWRVPLGEGLAVSDLAKTLGWPVLVVARAGLGTINHSVLTVEAIRSGGLVVAAVALNCLSGDDLAFAQQNAEQIRQLSGAPTLVVHDSIEKLASAVGI